MRSQRDGGSSSSSSECSCLPEAPLPDTSPLLVRRRMDRRDTGGDVAHSNAVANGVSMYDRGMLGSGRNPGDADGDGDEKDTPRDVDALRQRLREKDRKRYVQRCARVFEAHKDGRISGGWSAVLPGCGGSSGGVWLDHFRPLSRYFLLICSTHTAVLSFVGVVVVAWKQRLCGRSRS